MALRNLLTRIRGLLAIGTTLVVGQTRSRLPRRFTLTVLGVAFAVALFVTVAGVSIGLADQGSVLSANVDYWILPTSESSSSLPVSVGGPKFGQVHPVADRATSHPDIAYASPVLLTLASVTHQNTTEYVLVAGVIANDDLTVAGVPAEDLTTGDPHYANGTYNGPWTGQIVLSNGAAALLNATQGDALHIPAQQQPATNRSFTVTNVTAGATTGIGQFPIAVVHLAELQTLTGATNGDTADQLLVATTNPSVKPYLQSLYDHSRVTTRNSGSLGSLADSNLALALGAASLLVALIVGALFAATTMGLEVATDRHHWATLTALGYSTTSRAILLTTQTLLLTALGGLLGILLGYLGIHAANALIAALLTTTPLAVFTPTLAAAAFALAVTIGLLTTPYLLWLTSRTSVTSQLTT